VRLRDKLVTQGAPLSYANAIAANAVRESGANYQAREKGGNGRGLFQITDKARKALFRRITGVDVENSSEDQQIHFALYELEHSEKKNWQRALANGNEAGSVAAGYARYVERPANPDRDGAERAAVARALSAIPVHVTVEHKNAPPGTRTTVKAGRGPAPAISHAFEPVHGG
jgi:Phage tail lysozyme